MEINEIICCITLPLLFLVTLSIPFILIYYDCFDGFWEYGDDGYKYDKIHDKRRKMNKRERIEKLEQDMKKLNDIILEQQKHFDNEMIDMRKYALALCFIAKFKWQDIKNKQLREETQWKALCDLNKNGTETQMDYHLLHLMDTTRIEQVVDNPEKYSFDDVMKTYNYLQNILKKDKDISVYSKSKKGV